MARSYPPSEVESALQKGDIDLATKLGWWGDEAAFRLVATAMGGRAFKVSLGLVDLGLHLSNDTGVTSVESIAPGLEAAREGQLRPGDVIRQVLPPDQQLLPPDQLLTIPERRSPTTLRR